MQEFKENKQICIDLHCYAVQLYTSAITHGCMMHAYGSLCAMAVCSVNLLLSEHCTINDVHMQTT